MGFKSLTLLGLISLVALTGAKLRWKCELFDTSQETSTRTTFVEFVKGEEPKVPVVPNGPNPRPPRSPKCRPRPKNGTVGPSTGTEKLTIEKSKSLIQSDVPGVLASGDTDLPHVKYQRKETHQSLDLNIGPGFEESNDPYGRSKQPVPKLFRPAHLKGADELDKPLTEHLDENVMPDFELDDDESPPIEQDLPWCPEETDDDCETVDLEKLSVSELIELKQRCETTVSAKRQELIEKLIKTERGQPEVPKPGQFVVSPPTGNINCTTSPSKLKETDLEKYRKECPCEEDHSKMSEEEFAIFKKECLDPIEIPGTPHNLVRKNGRCGSSQTKINEMREQEYKLFVKECLVNPNIDLKKIIIIKPGPDCKDVDVKGMGKIELGKYQKKCLTTRNCDDMDTSSMDEKELTRFKKMCSPVIRKTNNLCEEENVDALDDVAFEKYKIECILGETPFDCDSVDPKTLSDRELRMYLKECPDPRSPPPVNSRMNCKNVNPDELSNAEYKKYERDCLEKSAGECARIDPQTLNDQEYKKYEEECLNKESNCTLADPREMTDEQYTRYERACLKKSTDCKDINVKDLTEVQYRKFRRDCLRENPEFDCSSKNVDEMSEKEYSRYRKECLENQRDFNCNDVQPKKLTQKQLKRYMRECVRESSDCQDQNVKEMSETDYEEYVKKCLKEDSKIDCSNVNPNQLTGDELRKYQRECERFDCNVNLNDLSEAEYKKYLKHFREDNPSLDCLNINPDDLKGEELERYNDECLSGIDCQVAKPEKMSTKEYKMFMRHCVKNTLDCTSVNVKDLSNTDYEKFRTDCLKIESDCLNIDTSKLNDNEYKQYKKECLDAERDVNCDSVNPNKLTREQYQLYEKKCLERISSENCVSINPNELSDDDYEKYRKDCLKPRARFDCKTVNVQKLSDKEYKKYEQECLDRPRNSDCDSVRPDELNEKEYAKYQRECLGTGKPAGCRNVNPDNLSREEYRKYEKECLPSSSPDCDGVVVDNLNDEEFARYKKRCSSRVPRPPGESVDITKIVRFNESSSIPPGVTAEACQNADVEKMTNYQYNQYKKYCQVNFEGTDCDEVRVDKLSEEKLQEYVAKCGLFCGIERKEALSKKYQRIYEERCEGDSNELEKDCKDIAIEKLGERMYADFAEKCLEPINACSMLKSRRLVRKVYNEYRLRCKPRLRYPENPRCEEADTEKMTLEEYKDYKRRCGKGRKDCDDVNVEELSDQEFIRYKKQCLLDTMNEDCKDINVDELAKEEYRRYLKKCGRLLPSEVTDGDCGSVEVMELTDNEFREYMKRCPDHSSDSIQKCNTLDWRAMSRKEYLDFLKVCPPEKSSDRMTPPGGESSKNCSGMDVEKMTEEEFEQYRKNCISIRRTTNSDCDDVDVNALSDEEYRMYERRCGTPRGPDYPDSPNRHNCTGVNIEELTSKEFRAYKKRCLTIRKTPDCSAKDTSQLSDEEYEVYRKKCSSGEHPEKPRDGCSSVNVSELSDEEYRDYKKKCLERSTSKPDCDYVNVNNLSDEEYRLYRKNCGSSGGPVEIEKSIEIVPPRRNGEDTPELERTPEDRFPEIPSVTIEKTVVVNLSKPPQGPDSNDCTSINPNELSDSEYEDYRRRCLERKIPKPDCDDIDVNKLSDEEYLVYKNRCGEESPESPRKPSVTVEKTVKIVNTPPNDGSSPPTSPNIDDCSNVNVAKLTDDEYDEYRRKCMSIRKIVQPECSDINIEELDKEEYLAYKKRCGPPDSPRSSNDCSDVRVEELTHEEYALYKKKCLKGKPPRRPVTPDENCRNVNINELSESEYRAFKRRCAENVTVEKIVVVGKECNRNTDEMTKEEYQKYLKECPQKPQIELTKTITIVPRDEDDCSKIDVNSLTDEEFVFYQKKCGDYKNTFQFNCNQDVTKMSDGEFEKFRKACGKKPFDCESTDVDSLSDRDYARFLKECGKRPIYNCKNAKVERMSSDEYDEYKRKCKKVTTKIHTDCDQVKVETLSRKEYAEFKERCLKNIPKRPTTTIRKRVDCSIVDESMMTDEEYADFKQNCNVKVTTDRYRPGENMILTKKVEIRTGKEKFSCYDQDVDQMSDEEYATFEKKCLANPHFRFDCSTVDTTNLSREEYAKYQRECPTRPEKTILIKTLIVNGSNEVVKNGCYNRDVDGMSNEEYADYEVRCLGREPVPLPQLERKTSFDCHNVDLSKLSYPEIEEHIKRCRTRETASTPPPPRRQSLKCSDVKTDDLNLNDKAYAKWVKECLPTPDLKLKKKIIIPPTPEEPRLSGGETVRVEKIEIYEHLRPDDDEGYWKGNEDFGVRVLTGIKKMVITGRPDEDSESEAGVILVKKVIHKIPGRRRPFDVDNGIDEGGVIEVKRMIMKTTQPEPDVDESEEFEEILRRPRKIVGPKEEVALLSVTKRHPHSYGTKHRPEEEEPTEVVKLTKNTKHPNATIREVRIRKHFGTGVPAEETVVQEIGGLDFKITRKTVMKPRKVRKLKSTTTTTTTPAEPEYYYDEEEVPEYITLVRVEKSSRPLRKTRRPEDEDDEYVDVKEDKPKSYIEFEGFVKVHAGSRKLRKKTKFTDSGEEPAIREVTRTVVPGTEDDDFKGVKVRSPRKRVILIRKIAVEVPDDVEHEVTVVKKLKVLKFGNEEVENFNDDDGNVEDDGKIIVRNRKRKYWFEDGRERPGEDDENEEYVEGRIAVKGRAPKAFRWTNRPVKKGSDGPTVTERTSQFYKIGGSEEDDEERRRRRRKEELRPRALEEEEEDGIIRRRRPDDEDGRRPRPRFEEESEEFRQRKRLRPGFEEEIEEEGKRKRNPGGLNEDVIIKKLYRLGQKTPFEENDGEPIVLTRKKIIKNQPNDMNEEEPDESGEIKLHNRRKLYRIPAGGGRPNGDDDQEIVKIKKKTVHRIGPNGEREYVDEDVPTGGSDTGEDEEIKLLKRRKFYRIRPDGKRELTRTEGVEPSDGEEVTVSKNKVHRIGPDGKRELVSEDEPGRKHSSVTNDQPEDDSEQVTLKKKIKRRYRVGPDGKRELIGTEGEGDIDRMSHGEESDLKMKRKSFSSQSDDQPDDEMNEERVMMKKKKFYRIGPDGKRELVREEEVPSGGMLHQKTSGLLGGNKNTYSPEPLNDESDDGEVRIKKRRFYKIGPDGKRELVREEGGDVDGSESSNGNGEERKIIHKKRRFYKIGPDGKRELVREEEGGDGGNMDNKTSKKSSVPNDQSNADIKMGAPLSDDVKPLPGGHMLVPRESEEKENEKNKRMSADNDDDDDDKYTYEMKPRVKRTYVLDGHGRRKLVDETTGDEKSNVDLGKLLKPRRRITETETVDKEHHESRYQKVGSTRKTRASSEPSSSGTSPKTMNGKMQKYHKDKNLRSGGKSEEDIPEEQ
ncbi:hypothetical protein L3Y34_014647 [Caenorhabditis briggsae]|uniref:Uncharacterized protein n=1 Tax=Caenorhabditis briggsae TaxID=6238 RepID=A0AAE9DRD6_CAEBR|nr:hypothetical protein L3Y34_014647 [Caenorhabditis briggsae]